MGESMTNVVANGPVELHMFGAGSLLELTKRCMDGLFSTVATDARAVIILWRQIKKIN